jgi:3-phenylpropionate/trans-cinnamate dioxygenase ferredoxin component
MGAPTWPPHPPDGAGRPGDAAAPRATPTSSAPSGPPAGTLGFVAVATVSTLAPGAMTFVVVERARVLLVNVEGTFYALQDACGHRGASLAKGTLTGHVVECPLHYACFDVRTGRLLNGPVSADLVTYEVRVEGDIVYVKR